MYLWRRPQVITPTNGDISAVGVSSARIALPKISTPAPVVAETVAEVNRQVRGSLEELKDSLFRLELRRQAGTITEADYERERQQMEKVLRDLVRG